MRNSKRSGNQICFRLIYNYDTLEEIRKRRERILILQTKIDKDILINKDSFMKSYCTWNDSSFNRHAIIHRQVNIDIVLVIGSGLVRSYLQSGLI